MDDQHWIESYWTINLPEIGKGILTVEWRLSHIVHLFLYSGWTRVCGLFCHVLLVSHWLLLLIRISPSPSKLIFSFSLILQEKRKRSLQLLHNQASFLKGQGHLGIFSLVKATYEETVNLNCSISRAPRQWPGPNFVFVVSKQSALTNFVPLSQVYFTV